MRFDMAKALVTRAKERAEWIGDDHGDPYEEALITQTIPMEMHLCIKEFLDHLRSSLDYCAHEICSVVTGRTDKKPIYFPITTRNFDRRDFRSRVGKVMPGLVQERPDIIPVLESFQPFSSSQNDWLADLATLSNHTKHIQLEVNIVDTALISFRKDKRSGVTISRVHRADGKPVISHSFSMFDAPNGIHGENHQWRCLRFVLIDRDLLDFVPTALSGTRKIISEIEKIL